MDSEKTKRISDLRASLGNFSNLVGDNDLGDLDDPVSAYFKQRCWNGSKTYFKKETDSDNDSSFGLIDVDCVSLFDNDEENENKNLRFSELTSKQINRDFLKLKKIKKQSDVPKVLISEVESELDKQRALAQKALSRLSNGKANKSPKKTETEALTDISNKLMRTKLSVGNDIEGWFQPNSSSNTPRYFNDELSSLNDEDENISKSIKKVPITIRVNENRESKYTKKINAMFKELTHIPQNSDLEFESHTKEEQINMFEEEEKKFKLENSGLLHNSQISQFSGVNAEDCPQWPPESADMQKQSDTKNLSIGQFFNLRSNRVSSLIGSVSDDDLPESSEADLRQRTGTPSLNEDQNHLLSKSECFFAIGEKIPVEKSNFRRCVSNLDLKRSPEIEKTRRNSVDSCSSSSTLMIQDVIAGFGPGLSDSEMYEKLMNYKEKQIEKISHEKSKSKGDLEKNFENNETPKSSKILQQKGLKSCKKECFFNDSLKKSKNFGVEKLVLFKDKKFRDEKRMEKVKKAGNNKGFFASTPKSQGFKFQNDDLKIPRNRALMNCGDWEAPRVHSIQPIDLDKSQFGEDNDKTVTLNSTSTCSDPKKINDTVSIEDTIVAGDLTVLSQRIEEMKQDSVCIVRSDEQVEPVLLTIVQKLSCYPKGSVDCSALTPLIRDQFPELLAHHENQLNDLSFSALPVNNVTMQDDLFALPGSNVKFPEVWGLKKKIYACADLKKKILIPVVNASRNWFLVSLEYLELVGQQGKKLPGVKRNDEWCVKDFVYVSLKKTFLPPENQQCLKIFFKSKVATRLEIALTFHFKDLMTREFQKQSLRLLVTNVNAENHVSVLPNDPINFGIIADQCFDQTIVQVGFDGICELPLTVYIEKDESDSEHFILKPSTGHQRDQKYKNNMCYHEFQQGEKQVLEFRVCFQPNKFLKEDSEIHDFKAFLVLMLGGKTDSDGILRKIPIKGSVSYAHFLCNFSCCPLVFKASKRGQSVTRTYPLKNIGSIPITFSVSVISEDSATEEEKDLFVAPKSFYLAKDEEAGFNVIFNALSNQDCVKRLLRLQMKPNGRVLYETELIGIVSSPECRPVSRTSGSSISTKVSSYFESGSAKLRTTCLALSWTGVALETEARQSCQIKIMSSSNASIKVTFERNLEAFKLVNENGEKVHKLRRTLMPDCPCTLTVVFRPDVVGAHTNALKLETNRSSHKYTIALNGIGGIPNLEIKNVKTDLIGCKILSLQYSHKNNEFESMIVFKNKGRIPSFVYLMPGIKDFSLSHELSISPSSVVICPNSTVSVKVSQKLKNKDLQQLLSDREIRRIATISLASGDEPSRLRLRKIINSGRVQASELLRNLTAHFVHEKELNLKNFEDSSGFEGTFLKSLSCIDIAVVVEKAFETSFLEETADEFMSFCCDNTVINAENLQEQTLSKPNQNKFSPSSPVNLHNSIFLAELMSTNNKINKWLDTLEYHQE